MGKLVSIRVTGTSLDPKPGESDAQGKATVEVKVPDLAQGTYDIVAGWKGDAGHKPATGAGKLTVIKAPTRPAKTYTRKLGGSFSTSRARTSGP